MIYRISHMSRIFKNTLYIKMDHEYFELDYILQLLYLHY